MTSAHELLAIHQGFTQEKIPRFDYHLHTQWTDGENSVQEMHARAVKCGLTHILFSEHVRHTSGDWFGKFAQEVRASSDQYCQSLVGMETKIASFHGELDTTTEMLAQCDLVMASVHRFPGEEGIMNKASKQFESASSYDDPIETEFTLANLILENKHVHILGHPFGMVYKRFKLIPPQEKIIQLIKKAAITGVAFEINSRYHPDPWELVRLCQKYNAMISLGSNAHCVQEVGRIVEQLRQGVICEEN